MLNEMLSRVRDTVARVHRRPDSLQHTAIWLQGLLAATERFLAGQAPQHVTLEHDITPLRGMFPHPRH